MPDGDGREAGNGDYSISRLIHKSGDGTESRREVFLRLERSGLSGFDASRGVDYNRATFSRDSR